jgi:hypothetical protein
LKKHKLAIPRKGVMDLSEGGHLYISFDGGIISRYNMTCLTKFISKSEDTTKKQNYNPHRSCYEDFDD